MVTIGRNNWLLTKFGKKMQLLPLTTLIFSLVAGVVGGEDEEEQPVNLTHCVDEVPEDV